MAIELKIPEVGESITEVEIGEWLKKKGELVRKDEAVVTLESEKATVELPAPESGTLTEVLKKKGEVARVGEVIAYLEKDGSKTTPGKPAEKPAEAEPERAAALKTIETRVMPAAERVLAERGLKPAEVEATGPGGRLLKYAPRVFRLLTDSMVFKDDPEHKRLRALVSKAFTPRRVQPSTSARSPRSCPS